MPFQHVVESRFGASLRYSMSWCHILIWTLKRSPRFADEHETLLPFFFFFFGWPFINSNHLCAESLQLWSFNWFYCLPVDSHICLKGHLAKQHIEYAWTVQEESKYHFTAFGKCKNHELRIDFFLNPYRADKTIYHL